MFGFFRRNAAHSQLRPLYPSDPARVVSRIVAYVEQNGPSEDPVQREVEEVAAAIHGLRKMIFDEGLAWYVNTRPTPDQIARHLGALDRLGASRAAVPLQRLLLRTRAGRLDEKDYIELVDDANIWQAELQENGAKVQLDVCSATWFKFRYNWQPDPDEGRARPALPREDRRILDAVNAHVDSFGFARNPDLAAAETLARALMQVRETALTEGLGAFRRQLSGPERRAAVEAVRQIGMPRTADILARATGLPQGGWEAGDPDGPNDTIHGAEQMQELDAQLHTSTVIDRLNQRAGAHLRRAYRWQGDV